MHCAIATKANTAARQAARGFVLTLSRSPQLLICRVVAPGQSRLSFGLEQVLACRGLVAEGLEAGGESHTDLCSQ